MKTQKRQNLKIGHLISNYLPSVGGAQVCIHHVANRIIDGGDEAVVMTPARSGGNDSAFKYEILRLNPLLNRLLFVNFSLGKIYLERILTRIQKKHNFDIWQVTFGYPLGAAAVDFFNKHRIPCILRCAGEDIQTVPSLKYGYRLNKKVDKKIKENYRKFTAVVALSNSMRKDYLLLGVPEDKIFLIPNGVDCSKFEMRIDRGRIRDELGVSSKQSLIITVGRNHPKKGFKYIPQIIKQLVKKHFDFKWFLVGKDSSSIKLLAEKEGLGEYLINEEVNPRISEKGEFEVPNNRLIQYYKASDIFVFPTLIETFGKVIVEAMAAGLPIVTTDAPGVDDIIKNNENGLKCKVADVGALTEAILKMFSDEVLAKRLRENALRDAKNYDWNKIIERYLELYHQVIEHQRITKP